MGNGIGGRAGAAVGIMILVLATSAGADETRWSFEMHGGQPLNLDSRVTFEQEGHPDVETDARWITDPMTMPWYYDFRLTRWSGRDGWSLGFFHHKLIMENPPAEVRFFNLTHGYNIITVQRMWLRRGFVLSAGGGVVMTHPESIVRGRYFDEHRGMMGTGYYVSGPVAMAGVGRRLRLVGPVYGSLEGRASVSHVRAKIDDGHAELGSVSFHALFGAGVDF